MGRGEQRWLIGRCRREVSPCLFDGASDGDDPTVIDTAELTIPGLLDKAGFKEEAVPGESGLFFGPEIVHPTFDELAELPGIDVVSELDSRFGSRHRPCPPIPSEHLRKDNRKGRNLIVGI